MKRCLAFRSFWHFEDSAEMRSMVGQADFFSCLEGRLDYNLRASKIEGCGDLTVEGLQAVGDEDV